jgi:peptidoglycan/LPS O-acetylase OafA/YrhL
MQRFLKRFKRITYSTSYLPEIDGLRFLAIFSVVVILHITNYLDEKFYNLQLIQNNYWKNFVTEGGNGVALFFIISGFILSLPFAKWRLNQGKKISLKNYYLRRVTRLEPPYIIALIIFFIANVWVIHKYSFGVLLPHFLASAVYLHGAIYHSFSWVLPIAWSLEVEVQFYLLAPLFFLIFLIRSALIRRLICLMVIFVNAVIWYDQWGLSNVVACLHFFFSGILIADLYCSGVKLFPGRSGFFAGMMALAGFLFLPSINYLPGYFLKLICMFVLMHAVLANEWMKKIFSVQWIVVIGGMCYSIYLLHLAIVSAAGYMIMKTGVSMKRIHFVPALILFSFCVLIVSAIYFLLVERPFMKPFGLKRNHRP